MVIELPPEYDTKVAEIRNTLASFSSIPNLSQDIQTILDLLVNALAELDSDNHLTDEQRAAIRVEDITGYIDSIEIALNTIATLMEVVSSSDVANFDADLFKLMEIADRPGDEGRDLLNKLRYSIKEFIDARDKFRLGIDYQTDRVIAHDLKRHMTGMFEGIMHSIYFATRKGSAFAFARLDKSAYPGETSIARALQNVNSYINYLYLVLAASKNLPITAADFELARYRFLNAKVSVTGDPVDIRQEAMAASLTLLLNSMAAVDDLELGLEGRLSDEQKTVEVAFESNMDFEAALKLMESETSGAVYSQSLLADDMAASRFGVVTLKNVADEDAIYGKEDPQTRKREGGLIKACEEYFANPVTDGARNGLRIVMSMISCDAFGVEYMRKIAGLNVTINKNETEGKENTPYEVRVSVIYGHKSAIVPPPDDYVIESLKKSGRDSITLPDGRTIELPPEEE